MKAIVHNFRTEIFLSSDEVREYCKPGEGADTCVWLVAGLKGFECVAKNKILSLLDRWEKGLTVAKRDGCDKVKNWHPTECGEQEF